MEIMAAIVGLRAVREPSIITLYSDSRYVIKTLTQGWKRMKTWTSGPGWTMPQSRTTSRGNGFGDTTALPETTEPTNWRTEPLAGTERIHDSIRHLFL
jgi:ribonuclease HI